MNGKGRINIVTVHTPTIPARCFGMNMPKSRDIQDQITIAAGNLE